MYTRRTFLKLTATALIPLSSMESLASELFPTTTKFDFNDMLVTSKEYNKQTNWGFTVRSLIGDLRSSCIVRNKLQKHLVFLPLNMTVRDDNFLHSCSNPGFMPTNYSNLVMDGYHRGNTIYYVSDSIDKIIVVMNSDTPSEKTTQQSYIINPFISPHDRGEEFISRFPDNGDNRQRQRENILKRKNQLMALLK